MIDRQISSNLQQILSTIKLLYSLIRQLLRGTGFIFIGLARINQIKAMPSNSVVTTESIQFVVSQKHARQAYKESKVKCMLDKQSPCRFYDYLYVNWKSRENRDMLSGKKGDIFTLTLNLLQHSLAWFKNIASIERGYLTCQDPILYPFITLDDGIQVII